mgnify:CR=1 FL=1
MAYTMEDFKHDARRVWIEHLDEFDPEERDAILARMTVEERLRGLTLEECLRGLKPEEREALLGRVAGEDRLQGLDPDWVKGWLKRNGH